MSDAYYREQAARKARKLWLAGGTIAIIACLGLGLVSLYYDSCTGSFDRSPEAVVRNYAQAVSAGQLEAAKACWDQDAYFNLEAGCSELCLQAVAGNGFEISGVQVGQAEVGEDNRSRLPVQVDLTCQGSGESQSALLVMDTAGQGYPWRHWHIVQSSLGGTVAEPMCP